MRVFVASLAIETYTFSPLYVNRSAFESAFYCPPGSHPETPTLCSAPVVAARRRAQADGFTLPHQRDGRGCRCGRRFQGISAHRLPRPSRGSRRFLNSHRLRRGSAHARCIRLPCDRSLHDQPVAMRQWFRRPHHGPQGPGRHPQHHRCTRFHGGRRVRHRDQGARLCGRRPSQGGGARRAPRSRDPELGCRRRPAAPET